MGAKKHRACQSGGWNSFPSAVKRAGRRVPGMPGPPPTPARQPLPSRPPSPPLPPSRGERECRVLLKCIQRRCPRYPLPRHPAGFSRRRGRFLPAPSRAGAELRPRPNQSHLGGEVTAGHRLQSPSSRLPSPALHSPPPPACHPGRPILSY